MNAPRPDPATGLFLNERERKLLAGAASLAARHLPRHLPESSQRVTEKGREVISVRCGCGGTYAAPAGGDTAGALEAARLAHVLHEEENRKEDL